VQVRMGMSIAIYVWQWKGRGKKKIAAGTIWSRRRAPVRHYHTAATAGSRVHLTTRRVVYSRVRPTPQLNHTLTSPLKDALELEWNCGGRGMDICPAGKA